jgi:hypothetical protein
MPGWHAPGGISGRECINDRYGRSACANCMTRSTEAVPDRDILEDLLGRSGEWSPDQSDALGLLFLRARLWIKPYVSDY